MKIFSKWRQRKPQFKEPDTAPHPLPVQEDQPELDSHQIFLGVGLPNIALSNPDPLHSRSTASHDVKKPQDVEKLIHPKDLSELTISYGSLPKCDHDHKMSRSLYDYAVQNALILSIGTFGEELISNLKADDEANVIFHDELEESYNESITSRAVEVLDEHKKCYEGTSIRCIKEAETNAIKSLGETKKIAYSPERLHVSHSKELTVDYNMRTGSSRFYQEKILGSSRIYQERSMCCSCDADQNIPWSASLGREDMMEANLNMGRHRLLSISQGQGGSSDQSAQNKNLGSAKILKQKVSSASSIEQRIIDCSQGLLGSSRKEREVMDCSQIYEQPRMASCTSCVSAQRIKTPAITDPRKKSMVGSLNIDQGRLDCSSQPAQMGSCNNIDCIFAQGTRNPTFTNPQKKIGPALSHQRPSQEMSLGSFDFSSDSFSSWSSSFGSSSLGASSTASIDIKEHMVEGNIDLKQTPGSNRADFARYSTDEKNKEEVIDYEMATLNCLKVISTNYQLDLKRLIISVTPVYLAKHLLQRLKPNGLRRKMKDPIDCSYQSKFSKFLRMFKMKHRLGGRSRSAAGIVGLKRELDPPAALMGGVNNDCSNAGDTIDDDDDDDDDDKDDDDDDDGGQNNTAVLMRKEEEGSGADDEQLQQSKTLEHVMRNYHSSSTSSSMRPADHHEDILCENWINTDDDYVVLELAVEGKTERWDSSDRASK